MLYQILFIHTVFHVVPEICPRRFLPIFSFYVPQLCISKSHCTPYRPMQLCKREPISRPCFLCIQQVFSVDQTLQSNTLCVQTKSKSTNPLHHSYFLIFHLWIIFPSDLINPGQPADYPILLFFFNRQNSIFWHSLTPGFFSLLSWSHTLSYQNIKKLL